MARTRWLIFVAVIHALIAIAAISPRDVYAHTVTQCQGNAGSPRCDQGYAFAALQTILKEHCAVVQAGALPANVVIAHNQAGKTYSAEFRCRNSQGSYVAFNQSHLTRYGSTCSNRAEYNGAYPNGQYKPRSGSMSCDLGCEMIWFHNADGTVNGKPFGGTCTGDDFDSDDDCALKNPGSYYNRQIGVCEPKEPECPGGAKANSLGKCEPEPCPEGMAQQPDGTCRKKENECPAGQVRSPDGRCLPGDGQCAKGEVRGPDGTCKKDSDDDGNPDEPGEKDTFSGGDDCSMPPSCSGSPILCGQARIQWRIDCNTRKNRNIAGGSCAAMPVCTGEKCDAMEYAGLLMQWRTACATEKLAGQGNNNGGDGAQPEWTKVGGMSTDPGLGSSPDDTKVLTVKKLGVEQLDQSGFGGGGSCIGFAVSGGSGIGSGFAQAMASPPDFFCNYIILIRAVIILSATVTCAFILTSGGKN